jgi:antitoxin FitA
MTACISYATPMPLVQIRDVPEDVHAELTAQAERAGMSLNRYLLQEVTHLARRNRNAEFFRRARAIPGPRLSRESIVREIRAIRGVDEEEGK